ncbi:MAG: hypothetical protein ACK46X_05360, partial [Candidatus Sericytochromatia bacterium]
MRAPVALTLALTTLLAPAALAAAPVPEAPLKAKAQAYYPAYVKDLEHLTNIDSGTGDLEGSRAIADWLDVRLKALGAKTERVQSPKGT